MNDTQVAQLLEALHNLTWELAHVKNELVTIRGFMEEQNRPSGILTTSKRTGVVTKWWKR